MISVIFVHYAQNRERSLLARYSLCSLQNSLNSPAEIIVIDNGGDIEDSRFFLEEAHNKRIAHYLRNGDNLHFGYARNQGIGLATGDYIAIVDNDLSYTNNWLEACLDALIAHSDKKLIASPIDYPTNSLREKYFQGNLLVKEKNYKLSMRAGSNCMVMRKEIFKEVGLFQLHRIAGTLFTDTLVRNGYLTIVTPHDMVKDLGLRKGYNLAKEIEVIKTLSDGTYKIYPNIH